MRLHVEDVQDPSGWRLQVWLDGAELRLHLEPPPNGWTLSGYRRLRVLIRVLAARHPQRCRLALPDDAVRGYDRLAQHAGLRQVAQRWINGRLATYYRRQGT